jgi:hypothetical protein
MDISLIIRFGILTEPQIVCGTVTVTRIDAQTEFPNVDCDEDLSRYRNQYINWTLAGLFLPHPPQCLR